MLTTFGTESCSPKHALNTRRQLHPRHLWICKTRSWLGRLNRHDGGGSTTSSRSRQEQRQGASVSPCSPYSPCSLLLSLALSCSLLLSLALSCSLSLSLTLSLSLSYSLSLSLTLSLSYSLSFTLSLFLSDVDKRSPVAGSREECVAGQQTQLLHTKRETATAVQLRNRKSQTSRWNPATLTRESTQNQRHEARNAPSPAFNWHLFSATAIQPTWVSTTRTPAPDTIPSATR